MPQETKTVEVQFFDDDDILTFENVQSINNYFISSACPVLQLFLSDGEYRSFNMRSVKQYHVVDDSKYLHSDNTIL